MFKKKFMFLLMSTLLIFGGSLSFFSLAHADDDRDEEEYEKDDDEEEDDDDDEDEEKISNETKTYEETVVVEPAKIVTENQLQTVFLPDRDRDGIPDNEDLHPDIAEIYIVVDDNLNGIVDTFEYEK